MSQDVTPLQVKSSDKLARNTKRRFEIENNKTQQPENTANNNQILAAVIARMQDARHPIHRVRIFISQNVSQCSQKQLEDRISEKSLSNAPMTPERH